MARAGRPGLVVLALDLAAVLVATWSAHEAWTWWKPQLTRIVPIAWWELLGPTPFAPPGAVVAAGWLGALLWLGLYDPGRMTSSVRIIVGLSRATVAVLVGVVVLNFLWAGRTWSRMLILLYMGGLATWTALFRLVFFRLQRHVSRPITQISVALVGVGEDARRMARRIERYGHASFRVAGFLTPIASEPRAVPESMILGEASDFARLVNAHDLQMAILATFALQREEALALATRADQMGVKVFQVPFTWGAASPRVDLARLGDLELIDLTALAYPSAAAQVKRVMDLVLVGVGGALLLPFLLVLAIGLKLSDRGPVLFVQPRAGRGGRQFPFYKFRSMVEGAEDRRQELESRNEQTGPLFKLSDDPRVTRFGRFLRRWSIDELPQLYNVLRGDMNLVGPRPLPMRDLEGIADDPEILYWLELRGKVKPGVTGPWQVKGRADLGFREMVALDIAYVQDWSLWLDLLILLKTLPAVLRGRGAR